MFRKLTYQQKTKGALILFLIILTLSYPIAIVRTVDEYKLYKANIKLKNEFTFIQSIPSLQEKSKYLNILFSKYSLDTINSQKNLLTVAASFCNKNDIQLKEYKPDGLVEIHNITILTRHIVVEGSFIDCLKLNYQLERENQVGRIASVLYRAIPDIKNQSTKLTCTIYIQNIIGNQIEKNE